jgi:hypothetical protein
VSFRPSRLERSRRTVDELCAFVDSLTDLGEKLARCLKAWRKVALILVGTVTVVTTTVTSHGYLIDLIHLALR